MFRNSLKLSPLIIRNGRHQHKLIIQKISSFITKPLRNNISKQNHLTLQKFQFSGIGKGVDVLEEEPGSLKCTIRRFGEKAFQVNNVFVSSSVLLFPNSFLQWKVRSLEEFKVDDLFVFTLLYPTPQILVFGTGDKMFHDRKKHDEIINYLKKFGIACEIMKTPDAAATFNLLNAEGRNVVAALLTLEPVTDEDIYGLQLSLQEFQSINHERPKNEEESS
jgi:NADH dehydrogenase [ubiquinone] 1 alpha subcomplex assembly factor 3